MHLDHIQVDENSITFSYNSRMPANKALDIVLKRIFNMELSSLLTPRRDRHLVLPRQLVQFLLRLSGYSNRRAGEVVNRDHATCTYSFGQIINIINTKYPRHDYNRIIQSITAYSSLTDCDLSALPRDWKNSK